MKESSSASPLISFCFTTYKRGAILKNTLESIKRQTYQNFEVIVCDNDPEGSGKDFVDSMQDERFKYFNNGRNLGMKPSFNKSLGHSSGEYIVMIADDDPVYYDMLQTLVDLKNSYPGYGMYMGGCDWFCEDKEVAELYKLKIGTNSCVSDKHDLNYIQVFSTADFIKTLFSLDIFSHFLWSTCIVKRDILMRMGGVPDYGTPFLGDFAYMSIASTGNGCVVINRALGCQTMHKENFGRNQNDHLPLLAKNFPAYLDEKLSYLKEWSEIRRIILNFFSLWITGHMAFLYHYYKKKNLPDNGLLQAEKEVFKHDFIKKLWFKYFMKKRFPYMHDMLVKVKKLLKGN